MASSAGRHRCCLRRTDIYARYSAFDRRANLLMTGGITPQLWDLRTGRLLRTFPVTGMPEYYAAWDIALTPMGDCAVASYSDHSVRVWDTASGAEVLRWKTAAGVATGMAVTQHRVLVGNRWRKQLLLYNLQTGEELFCAKTRTSGTEMVAISDDGRLGLSGGGDKRIRLWDFSAGRQVSELTGHTGRVHCLRFGPGGRTAVSGSSDKTVRIWDLNEARELMSFGDHPRILDCVAFAPDGSSVASGARDGIVRVWKLTGDRAREFHGHLTSLTSLAYRPGGRSLVSAGFQDVWVWDLTTEPPAESPEANRGIH
jgi:WD40 repeat protein